MNEEKPFTRREFQDGDVITLENNRRNWRVYDCPTDLINKYISYAKLYEDNQVWKVLERGMRLLMKEEDDWKQSVERRIKSLEDKINNKEIETPKTFGNNGGN